MHAQPPATPTPAAPLGVILRSLAALIARRFLNHPSHAVFILPLWRLLTRAAGRLESVCARLAAGPLPPPRPRTPHPGGTHRKPEFPKGRAWLIRALGAEAAVHAAQLEALLARPEAADLLANPTAVRILAPIRRLLGQVPPRRRKPRVPAPKPPPPPPIPPHQSLDPPARRPRRPWWLPPPHLRSG